MNFSEEKYNKEFSEFIKNNQIFMEMMIIYGYFTGKMDGIINTKFIMTINIGEEM